MPQLALLERATRPHSHHVAVTPEVERALADRIPVTIGVSGGKDSTVFALQPVGYWDGPRLLVHGDLGEIEWAESLPVRQRLANLPLSAGLAKCLISRYID